MILMYKLTVGCESNSPPYNLRPLYMSYPSETSHFRRFTSNATAKMLSHSINRPDTGETGPRASKLERALIEVEIPLRPMSREGQAHIHRHAVEEDKRSTIDELDFSYDIDPFAFPVENLRGIGKGLGSFQEAFDAVLWDKHIRNEKNFSGVTNVRCLVADGEEACMLSFLVCGFRRCN